MNLIHKQSANHKNSILNSKFCGCFYCLEIFSPNKVEEWIDQDEDGNGTTALCPYCGVDSVLPDNIGAELNHELLKSMKNVYF